MLTAAPLSFKLLLSSKHTEEKKMTKSKSPMTAEAQRRIQGAEAKGNNGQVTKDSFSARAQRVVDKKNK